MCVQNTTYNLNDNVHFTAAEPTKQAVKNFVG